MAIYWNPGPAKDIIVDYTSHEVANADNMGKSNVLGYPEDELTEQAHIWWDTEGRPEVKVHLISGYNADESSVLGNDIVVVGPIDFDNKVVEINKMRPSYQYEVQVSINDVIEIKTIRSTYLSPPRRIRAFVLGRPEDTFTLVSICLYWQAWGKYYEIQWREKPTDEVYDPEDWKSGSVLRRSGDVIINGLVLGSPYQVRLRSFSGPYRSPWVVREIIPKLIPNAPTELKVKLDVMYEEIKGPNYVTLKWNPSTDWAVSVPSHQKQYEISYVEVLKFSTDGKTSNRVDPSISIFFENSNISVGGKTYVLDKENSRVTENGNTLNIGSKTPVEIGKDSNNLYVKCTTTLSTTETEISVSVLVPNSTYTFELCSYNGIEKSQTNVTLQVTLPFETAVQSFSVPAQSSGFKYGLFIFDPRKDYSDADSKLSYPGIDHPEFQGGSPITGLYWQPIPGQEDGYLVFDMATCWIYPKSGYRLSAYDSIDEESVDLWNFSEAIAYNGAIMWLTENPFVESSNGDEVLRGLTFKLDIGEQ